MLTEHTPPGNSAVNVPVTKTGGVGAGGCGDRSLSTSSVLVLTVDTVVEGDGVGGLLDPISKKEVGVETILLELKGEGVTGGLSR